MKRSSSTIAAIAFAAFGFCSGAGAKIVTIEIADAHSVNPAAINDKGQVAGTYEDASYAIHGFLRQPDGTLATFDVADTRVTSFVTGLSAKGVVSGWWSDGIFINGFTRAVDGTITGFRAPRAQRTTVYGANAKNWLVGEWSQKAHTPAGPYLRKPSGRIEEFTVPDAAFGAYAVAVNALQTVAGEVEVAPNGNSRAFVRTADGTITVFGDANANTWVVGINGAGTIAGWLPDNSVPIGLSGPATGPSRPLPWTARSRRRRRPSTVPARLSAHPRTIPMPGTASFALPTERSRPSTSRAVPPQP